MSSRLGTNVAGHYARLAAVAAEAVAYSRGAVSAELVATPASTRLEVTDESGVTIQTQATDFLISADLLVLGGIRIEPEVGDRITMTAHGRALVFEVLQLAGGGHAELDVYGLTWRIHTKQIDEIA